MFGRPVKIEIQVFPALNVVPGPLDSRLVQHLFYVTKIRMASLDELDRPSPIEELLDTVAQVVMPKKEFLSPNISSPSVGGPTIGGPTIGPTFGPTLRPSVPGVGSPGVGSPGVGSPGVGSPGVGSPGVGAPRQANNAGGPGSKTDAEAKAKDPSTRNKLIKAGVAAALIAGIIAAALASYLASAGAEIKFKRIVAEKTTVFGYTIGTPTKVGVTWSVKKVGSPGSLKSAVKITDTDDIEWHDSTIDTLDGTDVPVTKVKGDKEFVVDSKKSDSSTIDLTDKGYGVIKTSFESHVDQAVKDAGAGTADLLGDFLGGLMDIDFGALLMIGLGVLIVVLIGPIVFDLIKSMMSKSNNNGSGKS